MLRRADRVLGALVLLKALDGLQRGPGVLGAPGWALALLLLAGGGAALAVRPSRGAWAVVLAGVVVTAVDAPVDLRRQHLVLLGAAALGAVVATQDAERLLLWRALVSVLYGTAALAKLNETFLGGDVLAVALREGPFPVAPPTTVLVLGGLLVLAAEAALAAAPWVRWSGALPIAVVLHAGALVALSGTPLVGLRLLFFGGVSVVLVAVSARPGRGS